MTNETRYIELLVADHVHRGESCKVGDRIPVAKATADSLIQRGRAKPAPQPTASSGKKKRRAWASEPAGEPEPESTASSEESD